MTTTLASSRRQRHDEGAPASDALLDDIQRATFDYFLQETNPRNGLVVDSTHPDSPASIAAVGFALAAYPVAVERGWMTRTAALDVTLATLRFFHEAPQDGARDGVGYRGFYYHFLHMETGRRAWRSELSTIDTTFLLAGALAAAEYFDGEGEEAEVPRLANALYRRAEWEWALDGGATVRMAWKPERGFLRARWQGYNEAILLYALALGSPTHPIPPESYDAYTSTYNWKKIYDTEYLYAGPLFIHQFSHLWIDFRGIPDAYMREHGIDYFENSRRATHVQREYAIKNPRGFRGYGPDEWGLTASDGPGPAVRQVNGKQRRFWGYRARGVPFGPDDGTLSPWAAIASLPFAPDVVLACIQQLADRYPGEKTYGFENSFNPTFPGGDSELGWISPHHYALNEGPIVLAIENYRSGHLWRLMRRCQPLRDGLRRAGFSGGWLGGTAQRGS
jgi:hypothetical protein